MKILKFNFLRGPSEDKISSPNFVSNIKQI